MRLQELVVLLLLELPVDVAILFKEGAIEFLNLVLEVLRRGLSSLQDIDLSVQVVDLFTEHDNFLSLSIHAVKPFLFKVSDRLVPQLQLARVVIDHLAHGVAQLLVFFFEALEVSSHVSDLGVILGVVGGATSRVSSRSARFRVPVS